MPYFVRSATPLDAPTIVDFNCRLARETESKTLDPPVIADADTGYGNELNAVRTVREYERAGVAAIHIEDQAFPKKCGHLDNKEIVPFDDYVAKIRAAADARTSPDFVLIARTDARAVAGFDEADPSMRLVAPLARSSFRRF